MNNFTIHIQQNTHCGESSPTEPAPWGILRAEPIPWGIIPHRNGFVWQIPHIFISPTKTCRVGMIPHGIGSVGNDSPRSRFCGGWFPTVRFVLYVVGEFFKCFCFNVFCIRFCVMFLDVLKLFREFSLLFMVVLDCVRFLLYVWIASCCFYDCWWCFKTYVLICLCVLHSS